MKILVGIAVVMLMWGVIVVAVVDLVLDWWDRWTNRELPTWTDDEHDLLATGSGMKRVS